ncbi:MAG: hypothetical protein KAG64_04775 [Bacteroidales bacterium]|nr:hypothetical protein [Bacteroidales bacterium]
MKKLIVIIAIFMGFTAQAQKIKMVSGKLDFLKGQNELLVEFAYPEHLNIGKMTEADYITKKTEAAEEKKAGDGERWLKLWKGDRAENYHPKFIELLNDGLASKKVHIGEENSQAKYKMVVTTVFIEPGYNIGISRSNAYVNLEISFYEIGNNKELAKFTIMKSPGRAGGADFDSGFRIGEAYAKAAKSFAKFLLKKKAF